GNNNPVAGVSVSWAATVGGGSVSPKTSVTNALGLAQTTFTLGGTVGPNTAVATTTFQVVPFNATGQAGAAAHIAITSGNNQSAQSGQILGKSLVVTVTDQFGNPVNGETVNFAAQSGGGSITAISGTSGNGGQPAGQVAATARLGATVGVDTFTAIDPTLPSQVLVFSETATVGAPSTLAIVSGSPQAGATGSVLQPLVVLVTDGTNPVPGVPLTFAPSNGGTLSNVSIATDANGLGQATLTLGRTAGPENVTVTAKGVA